MGRQLGSYFSVLPVTYQPRLVGVLCTATSLRALTDSGKAMASRHELRSLILSRHILRSVSTSSKDEFLNPSRMQRLGTLSEELQKLESPQRVSAKDLASRSLCDGLQLLGLP